MRIEFSDEFWEEFRALRQAALDRDDPGYDLDRIVLAVRKILTVNPEAGMFLNGVPPIYLWHNNQPDETLRLSLFYTYTKESDRAVFMSIQRGKNVERPGKQPPNLF